jgi:hypothetical protein
MEIKLIRMQELMNRLARRLPDGWDALFVTLQALDKKLPDIQLREIRQSSGARAWVAE